nr:DUF177 domain-containing protein [Paraoerskovia marina]
MHDLARRPGSMLTVERALEAPADLGSALVGVPEGSPVALDVRMEAVMEGVLVSGTARTMMVGECGRCLDQFSREIVADIQELFVYPDRANVAEETGDDDEDLRELDGDLADIEPVLRDAVVTALPFQPLCSPDCAGLCSECGARLEDDPDHAHEILDPRWSALQSMFEDSNVSDKTKES